MAELVRAEKELSDWFPERSEFSCTEPLRWTAHEKISMNRALEKHERQFCMKSKPCSCFLAYNFGKNLYEK